MRGGLDPPDTVDAERFRETVAGPVAPARHNRRMSDSEPTTVDDIRAYLLEMATTEIGGGLSSPEEILETLIEHFGYEDPPLSEDEVRGVVEPMIAARRAEEPTWPERTDVDLLDDAFLALRHKGITAEENFTCCLRCGVSEIGDEADEDSHGFVFFHEQDTGHAVSGQGLMLAYGAFGGDPEASLAVGREVIEALGAAGLSAEWDGSVKTRIHVRPLLWRRRMPTDE